MIRADGKHMISDTLRDNPVSAIALSLKVIDKPCRFGAVY
jgi:hypothetical protein